VTGNRIYVSLSLSGSPKLSMMLSCFPYRASHSLFKYSPLKTEPRYCLTARILFLRYWGGLETVYCYRGGLRTWVDWIAAKQYGYLIEGSDSRKSWSRGDWHCLCSGCCALPLQRWCPRRWQDGWALSLDRLSSRILVSKRPWNRGAVYTLSRLFHFRHCSPDFD